MTGSCSCWMFRPYPAGNCCRECKPLRRYPLHKCLRRQRTFVSWARCSSSTSPLRMEHRSRCHLSNTCHWGTECSPTTELVPSKCRQRMVCSKRRSQGLRHLRMRLNCNVLRKMGCCSTRRTIRRRRTDLSSSHPARSTSPAHTAGSRRRNTVLGLCH